MDAEFDDHEPRQLVVISQTCDVVLPKRPTVILADVVTLAGADRSQAATAANPRFVAMPLLGTSQFADLCFVEAHKKEVLIGRAYTPGIDIDDEQLKRDFSLSLTRWFGRFPFPDNVVYWLRPLEHVIREKYRKQSTLGELLRELVVEIRVEEASQWSQAPYRLTVHTIVRAEALPTLADGVPELTEFAQSLRDPEDRIKSPAALADLLANTFDVHERQHILDALAESFATLCKPPKDLGEQAEVVGAAVSAVEWQLWGDDEFPLARVRKSEPLDLEYLSEPDHRL